MAEGWQGGRCEKNPRLFSSTATGNGLTVGVWGAFHGLICALISPSPVSDFPLRSGKKRYVTCPFVYSSVQSASDLTRHMERFPDSLDFFFDSISNIYLRKCQKRSDGTNLLFFTFKTDESPDPVFG